MEETKALLQQLHEDNERLRDEELPAFRAATDRKIRIRDWMIAALTVVLVASVLVIIDMVFYASCTAARSNALNGPGNQRVNLFFQAYTEAAGDVQAPLTSGQRATIIAGLDAARAKYQVIPAREQLMKDTDFQLLGFRDLIAALRANGVYQSELASHPVCSLWSL